MAAAPLTQRERLPLAGIRVLELGQRIGASVCGQLLSQLGADVVSLERPAKEPTAKWPFREQLGAGKLNVRPRDMAHLLQSAGDDWGQRLDVVVQSSDVDPPLTGGTNPWDASTILCDITAYGNSGPMAGQAHSDVQVQALSGIMSITGFADGPPVASKLPLLECLAGFNAASSVIAALRARRQGAGGQAIDIALFDSAVLSLSSALASHLDGSGSAKPIRLGNSHPLAVPWNCYECADGWILICTGSDGQWLRLCDAMGRPDLKEDPRFASSLARAQHRSAVDALVSAWTAGCTAALCDQVLQTAGVPGGSILATHGRPVQPNLQFRGLFSQDDLETGHEDPAHSVAGSPLGMDDVARQWRAKTAESGADVERATTLLAPRAVPEPRRTARASLPLSGVRVVEVGHYTTAPFCGRLLGSLGAEVIKVEPPGGEASRRWPPFRREESLFYILTNSDKSSVVIDLNTEQGGREFAALTSGCDVILENLKPGTLARKGFSYEVMKRSNPGLVYCAISGFGARSIYPGRAAFDTIVQGMAGIMTLLHDGDTPLKAGPSFGDIFGASAATLAILAALEARSRTNAGQFIDLSMQDVLAWSTFAAWRPDAATGPQVTTVQCQDGHAVALDLDETLKAAARDLRLDAFVSRCQDLGVAVAPVTKIGQLLSVPQIGARGLLLEISDERGVWPALASPLRLLGTEPRVRRPGPPLGTGLREWRQ